MPSVAAIRSEGDLEVVVLHESHELLADIIGTQLYSVSGTGDDQEIRFASEVHFDLFLVRIIEVFAEGARSAYIDEKYQNWSLLRGLSWLAERYPGEAVATGLSDSLGRLREWIETVAEFSYWCPDVQTQVTVALRNEQLISFAANSSKHHLLRVSDLFGKLERLLGSADYHFPPQAYPALLRSLNGEARSRLQYHSTYIVELLGRLFAALNRLIIARFQENPTNRTADMTMPIGITSDVFRDLYGSVMVFKRYSEERILPHVPNTTRFLRMRYGPVG